MKVVGTLPGKAAAALGAVALVALFVACEEDGKTAPERCSVLPAPVDIQAAGAPWDDNRRFNPGSGGENGLPDCVTEVGHAVSSFGTAGDGSVAGTSGSGGTGTAGSGTGGTSSGGSSSSGGDTGTAGAADAGAGGA